MIKLAVILVGLITISFELAAKVVFVGPHGVVVENQIEVKQSPQKVWNALVKDIDLWWLNTKISQ